MTKDSIESEVAKLKKEEESLRNEIKSEGDWFTWGKVLGCIIGVAVLWGVGWLPILYFKSIGEAGTFGDLFGSVNALFSGLAFAFVILALFAQRYDLKQQKRELRLSLIESQRARIEYEKMSDAQEDSSRWQFISAYLACINSQAESYIRQSEEERKLNIRTADWDYMRCELNLKSTQLLDVLGDEAKSYIKLRPDTAIIQMRRCIQRALQLLPNDPTRCSVGQFAGIATALGKIALQVSAAVASLPVERIDEYIESLRIEIEKTFREITDDISMLMSNTKHADNHNELPPVANRLSEMFRHANQLVYDFHEYIYELEDEDDYSL
ncbi:hypothetical protein [Thalassoroseus pseudoceratinae]|uniref:hypothetical protein n=1 Tax=Thalassoroseus pseudoceratinae TaxID=2713176 RepID=UPI00141E290A|nr:hypothetical protein [Thalassoroseus pseudoceratinae]